MRLRFTGFPAESWKRDQPASVDGYGEIAKGDTQNYDNDTAEWLLATKNFETAEDETLLLTSAPVEEPTEESTEPAEAPAVPATDSYHL